MKNDEAARQSRSDTNHVAVSLSAASVLIVALEQAMARGENPAAHWLWLRAPEGLRQRFADGYITAEDFWAGLRRWLEFEAAA